MRVAGGDPYVGLLPFDLDDAPLFGGRDLEVDDLAMLLRARQLVVVYGRPGVGKTSLMCAGVVPRMQKLAFEVLPPARVGSRPDRSVSAGVNNVYVASALRQWTLGTDATDIGHLTLAEFIAQRPVKWDADGLPMRTALLIDQFEELFYPDEERSRGSDERGEFFEQIDNLLNTTGLVRVVFILRSDSLAEFERFRPRLADRLFETYRIDLLSRTQALAAAMRPLEWAGIRCEAGVMEKVIEDLSTGQEDRPWDSAARDVEPVLLQLALSTLWNSIRSHTLKAPGVITHDLFEPFDSIFARHYESSLEQVAHDARVSKAALRQWIESNFITVSGARNVLALGAATTGGMPNAAIDALERERLVRIEMRQGTRYCALFHERFIQAILASNSCWRDAQARRHWWTR